MGTHRPVAIAACLLGFSGVALAALGSHAVPGIEDAGRYRSWQAANLMHLLHAGVMLALALRLERRPSLPLSVGAWLMGAGVLLFSGSIYLRLGAGLELALPLAPAGGVLLMLAWLALALEWLRN